MDKKEALKIVKIDGRELKNLPDHFMKDKEAVLDAVKKEDLAIGDEDKSFMKDRRAGDMEKNVALNKKLFNFIKWKPKYNKLNSLVKSSIK